MHFAPDRPRRCAARLQSIQARLGKHNLPQAHDIRAGLAKTALGKLSKKGGTSKRPSTPPQALDRPAPNAPPGDKTMNHLSSTDASFLHLETPETPMHIGSLMLFELPEATKATITKT